MEVDRKRPFDGPVPGAKRPNVEATGPIMPEEIELFQKEAIYRQMNAYRRERDELQSQINASAKGDEALREELAQLTEKYIAAVKQVERLASPSLARIMNTGKNEDEAAAGGAAAGGAGAGDNAGASTSASGSAGGTPAQSDSANGNAEETGAEPSTVLALKSDLAAAEGEITKLKEFIASEDQRRADLEQQKARLEEQLAASQSSAFEIQLKEARAESQRLSLEITNLQQLIADLKGSQAEYESQVREKSAATIASLERRLASAESDVSRLRGARDDLLSEVNVLKAECAEHKNEAARWKEAAELDSKLAPPSAPTEAGSAGAAPTDDTAENLPEDPQALRDRCQSLIKQNKALIEEISGLEQAFTRANSKAKAATKANAVIEQKLGVLNTAKVRSDEKYIGAMRARDSLNQELARLKQALTKSAEVVSDQKSLEQKLTSQVARLQKDAAQAEVVAKQRQLEMDALRRAKQESDSALSTAKAVQDKLREQVSQRDAEKSALATAQRHAETNVERLERQLDTQRAVSGLGSSTEVQEQLESLRSIAICPVCQKNFKNRAITTCGHTMCSDCIQKRLASRMRKCPMCNTHFGSNDVLTIHL